MMALAKAIVASNHTAQSITWKDEKGNAVVLTGATITGRKRAHSGTTITAIDGSLDISDGANGVFTWTYGTNDIATAGSYVIQFLATFGDSTIEKNFVEEFKVEAALAAP